MNNELINRHVQAVAIQFISYRGTLDALANFVAHSIGDSAANMAELTHYLGKEATHKDLLNWDVGLFKNTAGDWSLVSLATPPTIEGMRYRLEHFPTSNTQCRWCLQDAKRLADIDLAPEKDIHGLPVLRSLLHPGGCMKAWLTMRNQVARAQTKESLL
ncbi:hypothetical protein [Pseudomonas izuensis]|uniref:hypothetical protein n=1 Tax=Pseudomonas izuensis TaxID=2684212 RepID=UPI001357C350|nr:hypothetical protein [Pseudomonas izuensis]